MAISAIYHPKYGLKHCVKAVKALSNTSTLEALPFSSYDENRGRIDVSQWLDICCYDPSLENTQPSVIALRVPQMPDGWQARGYLYHHMLNEINLIQKLKKLSFLGSFSISAFCAFMHEGRLLLLSCVSEEITTDLFARQDRPFEETWKDFIVQSHLYRTPFYLIGTHR